MEGEHRLARHQELEDIEGEKLKVHIDIPRKEVAAFCRRWQINELAFFSTRSNVRATGYIQPEYNFFRRSASITGSHSFSALPVRYLSTSSPSYNKTSLPKMAGTFGSTFAQHSFVHLPLSFYDLFLLRKIVDIGE